MKIQPRNIKLPQTLKNALVIGSIIATPLLGTAQIVRHRNIEQQDTFEITSVTPKGVENSNILKYAPSPNIIIESEIKTAKFVVDLSKNHLYHYNEQGEAINAYLIASGKKSTPTETGVRIVTHVETYPYKTASPSTKRRKNPNDYGPKIICLRKLDPYTGETAPTGEFIHGNNNPASIGKYASKGCMRMDNEIIKKLAQEVKAGDIVVIKR